MLATNSILNSNQIEEVEFSRKNASDETTTERERRSRSRTSSITARRKAEEKLKTWHYNGTRKTVEGSLNVSSLLVPSSPFANVSSLRCMEGGGGYFYEVRVFPVEYERKSIIACHESEITWLYSLLHATTFAQDAI